MPYNSKVIIDCQIYPISSRFTNNTIFFDWNIEGSKTYIQRPTSDALNYHVNTNDYSSSISCTKIVSSIQLEPNEGTGIFTITFADGTEASSSRTNWLARTTNLRMRLQPDVYVKRIKQINENNELVHNLVPNVQNGVVGMYDVITELFYSYAGGNAYLTAV